MIVICEMYHREGAHAPFNAGLVEIVRCAFPGERVVFFGERSHLENVRDQVGTGVAATIDWRTVFPSSRNSWYPIRFWREVVTFSRIGKMLEEADEACRIVVASFDSARLLALKVLERSRLRNIPIQVVSHGEIAQGIVGGRHRHPWRRFRETRTALTLFRGSSIQYLVLEAGIRERLLDVVPSLAGHVEVLDHPLPPNETSSGPGGLETPVRFGFLGVANAAKGFSSFLELAAETAEKYPGKAEFDLVGRLPMGQESAALKWLATDPRSERLTRDGYVERVRRLHFAVMPYEPGCYELTASGTLLDAITWQVPVIATRIPIFEKLFTDCGDIGYLFGTVDELHDIVDDLLRSPDQSRYRTQVSNLSRLRASRSPERLALLYRAVCGRHKVQMSGCLEAGA